MDLGFVDNENEKDIENNDYDSKSSGRAVKFGKSDGDSCKTVCSRCSEEKSKKEIKGVGYEWVCNDCLEESDKE